MFTIVIQICARMIGENFYAELRRVNVYYYYTDLWEN